MKTKFRVKTRLFLALAGLLVSIIAAPPRARADDGDDEGDPPSLAARISFVEGNVSLQPNGEGDWGAPPRTARLPSVIRSGPIKPPVPNCRPAQASIHMGSMTALSFLNLDNGVMQVRIPEGTVNFRVRELREGDVYEVDTPNQAFTVRQAGAFRVEVSEDGEGTRITAIRGEGEVTAGGKTYDVRPGEMVELTGTDNPKCKPDRRRLRTVSTAGPPNATCAKTIPCPRNTSRATFPATTISTTTAPGTKSPNTATCGIPNQVAPDWAPYSYGYWNWVGPWGWTWIGYEPWGFAPFHYGRWSYIITAGAGAQVLIYARPVYGPAFVGFFGGSHFSVGIGFGGGVGWFPLGFGEPYHPWFLAGRGYVEHINIHNTVIHNTTIIRNSNYNYAYAHNTRAVTVASRNNFVERPVASIATPCMSPRLRCAAHA